MAVGKVDRTCALLSAVIVLRIFCSVLAEDSGDVQQSPETEEEIKPAANEIDEDVSSPQTKQEVSPPPAQNQEPEGNPSVELVSGFDIVHANESWSVQILHALSDVIKGVVAPFVAEFQKDLEFGARDEESLSNVTLPINRTALNASLAGDAGKNETAAKRPKFQCLGKNITANMSAGVEIVNSSVLLQKLSFEKNESGADCILVLFYASWCHFSASTAAQYNTLGRAFPLLDIIAVDADQFNSLHAKFGVVSVPNIMLFHQSRSVVRFNHSRKSFENMVQFVRNMTGLEPNASVAITDMDYLGPVSSMPTSEPDYLLWIAWVFVVVVSFNMFYSSRIGQQFVNMVHVLWQEHQHIE